MSSKSQFQCFFCCFALVMVIFCQCGQKNAIAQQPRAPKDSQRLSRFDTAHVKSENTFSIGINAKNSALLVTNIDPSYNIGKTSWLNVKSGRITQSKANTKDLIAESLQVSPNGQIVTNYDNIGYVNRKESTVHVVRVLDSSNAQIIKRFDIGRKSHIHRIFFHPRQPNSLIITATSQVPYEGDFTQGKDRIEFWNWRQGKRYKSLSYQYARNVEDILFSPDGKYIACFFFASEGFSGRVEFLNSATGKSMWGVDAPRQHPVDGANFFLSYTKLFCNGQVYDLSKKSITPFFKAGDRRLECVGEVESRLGMAFFTTKQGLELWNLATNKPVYRWPIRAVDYVELSPDKNVLTIHQGSIVEFWRFNPQWLK